MSKFFTATGDDGYTGRLGEGRIPKYHHIPETIGAIDESMAAVGVARASCRDSRTAEILLVVQKDLYHLMAEISSTPEHREKFRWIDDKRVAWLETEIDRIGELVEIPDDFILPGDSPSGADLDLARTIIRRAERHVAHLLHKEEVENVHLLRYLNRLSSLCFILELHENQASGTRRPTLAKE